MSNSESNVTHEPQWTLCLYFFLLCALSKVSNYLLKPIFKFILKPSADELLLRSKMHIIRTEQQTLSIKDNFAAHAKLQRQLNTLEDDLKDIVQSRREKHVKRKFFIQYGFDFLVNILIIISVIFTRSTPLIVLKHNLYPFEGLFSYPSGVPHAISSHAWAIISKISCHTILNASTKISDMEKKNKLKE